MATVRMAVTGLVYAMIGVGVISAQEPQERPLPPGTNPGQRVVYPSQGQDTPQQQQDQLECYWWSSDNTGGWDPYVAHAQLVEQGHVAEEQAAATQGGAIRGAAGGALVGVAIGAIAGDAGKGAAIGAVSGGAIGGMRSRRGRQQAQSQADAAVSQFNTQFQQWDRNWTACMSGRGYTIS